MSTYPPPASSLDPAFVTTALEIPGHRIVRNIGANAVISFRYDANELMNGVTEVLAYGTAVVVEPQ